MNDLFEQPGIIRTTFNNLFNNLLNDFEQLVQNRSTSCSVVQQVVELIRLLNKLFGCSTTRLFNNPVVRTNWLFNTRTIFSSTICSTIWTVCSTIQRFVERFVQRFVERSALFNKLVEQLFVQLFWRLNKFWSTTSLFKVVRTTFGCSTTLLN